MGATRAAKPFAGKTDILSKKLADLVHIGRADFAELDNVEKSRRLIERRIHETKNQEFVPNHNPNRLPVNAHYKAGPAQYDYYTDSTGRIVRGHADELKLKPIGRDRPPHSRRSLDKIAGIDNAGHLFADQFDGSHKRDNILSQAEALNKSPGAWYNMEKRWAKVLKDGGEIRDVEIAVLYDGSSRRPSGFAASYIQIVDGTPPQRIYEEFLENVKSPRGKVL